MLVLLLMQYKCEKIVLCKTSMDAQQAIHMPNVNAVFTADGSKRYAKRSTTVRFFPESVTICALLGGTAPREDPACAAFMLSPIACWSLQSFLAHSLLTYPSCWCIYVPVFRSAGLCAVPDAVPPARQAAGSGICQPPFTTTLHSSLQGYVPYRPPYHRRGKLGQDDSAYLRELDEALASAQVPYIPYLLTLEPAGALPNLLVH